MLAKTLPLSKMYQPWGSILLPVKGLTVNISRLDGTSRSSSVSRESRTVERRRFVVRDLLFLVPFSQEENDRIAMVVPLNPLLRLSRAPTALGWGAMRRLSQSVSRKMKKMVCDLPGKPSAVLTLDRCGSCESPRLSKRDHLSRLPVGRTIRPLAPSLGPGASACSSWLSGHIGPWQLS